MFMSLLSYKTYTHIYEKSSLNIFHEIFRSCRKPFRKNVRTDQIKVASVLHVGVVWDKANIEKRSTHNKITWTPASTHYSLPSSFYLVSQLTLYFLFHFLPPLSLSNDSPFIIPLISCLFI